MGRKRRKAPKILLHSMFQWIRGKMGEIVFRLSHNGEEEEKESAVSLRYGDIGRS